MRKAPDELTALLRGTIEAMGYELVGMELFRKGNAGLVLRIYIDKPDGIDLDDCSAVSHQVSGVLDVDDPIAENYNLEVSSPGLDRPLFELEHFERFAGHKARLKLAAELNGRRKLEGVLAGTRAEAVLLDVEGERMQVALAQIDSARLMPDF